MTGKIEYPNAIDQDIFGGEPKKAAPGVVGRCGDCKAFGPFKSFGGAKEYCVDCTVFNPRFGTENRFQARRGADE